MPGVKCSLYPLVLDGTRCFVAVFLFSMKLFRTNNIETVEVCQFYFGVSLPSVVLRNRSERFEQKFRLHMELLKAPV